MGRLVLGQSVMDRDIIRQWGWTTDAQGGWIHPETSATGYWTNGYFVNVQAGKLFDLAAYLAGRGDYLRDYVGPVPPGGGSWFDQEMIAGVPNIYLASGAAVLGALILTKKRKG